MSSSKVHFSFFKSIIYIIKMHMYAYKVIGIVYIGANKDLALGVHIDFGSGPCILFTTYRSVPVYSMYMHLF